MNVFPLDNLDVGTERTVWQHPKLSDDGYASDMFLYFHTWRGAVFYKNGVFRVCFITDVVHHQTTFRVLNPRRVRVKVNWLLLQFHANKAIEYLALPCSQNVLTVVQKVKLRFYLR